MARKLAINIVKIYKREKALKKALSGIMFDCLMAPLFLLSVLGKRPLLPDDSLSPILLSSMATATVHFDHTA